jgi:cellulose synthase/poly-beta-1,6-N-acetylglucosamine synthase-like glycosyltransferase
MPLGLLILPLLLWIVVAALACFGVYQAQKPRPPVAVGWVHDPAVVIIPVRSLPSRLDALWQGLSSQSYRPFRVVFVVESAADPVHAALKNLVGGPPIEIVVAGLAEHRGQKIHNMLAGLKRLRPDDAMIVFADADIVPDANWLARLAWMLEPRRGLDMASGYRWLEPADDRWATAFICVINSSIATAPRQRAWMHAWGGSMALRRQTVQELDLEALWDRAVDDDLTLSRALRARGGHVFSRRDVLVRTPASYGWRDGIAFARRQYLLARMHAPDLWLLAAGATTAPLLGWAVALPLALMGNKIAIAAIGLAVALDQMRAGFRRRVPRNLWGTELPPRVALLDRWATPVWLALHAGIIWSTAFGRSVTWSGRTYWIDTRQRVQRIEKAD